VEPPILNDKKNIEKDTILINLPKQYNETLRRVAALENTKLNNICLKAINLYSKTNENQK
jgi:hypothetical protein